MHHDLMSKSVPHVSGHVVVDPADVHKDTRPPVAGYSGHRYLTSISPDKPEYLASISPVSHKASKSFSLVSNQHLARQAGISHQYLTGISQGKQEYFISI